MPNEHDQTERTDPDVRQTVLVVAAAVAAGVVAVSLLGVEIDRTPAAEAGRGNLRALAPYWIASGLAWIALTALWRHLAGAPGRSTAPGTRRAAITVLLVATAARLVVLAGHEPTLSDDINRYVFDARTSAAGVNPYLPTPEERASIDPSEARWTGEIARAASVNNPELHTIYLPASQWCFTAIALPMPRGWSGATVDRWMRAAFVVVELVVIGLLLIAVRRTDASPWWVALYAWHPLPLAEIAGSGHQDVLGLVFLVAALVLADDRCRRWVWAVALAALVKPFALPAAAFILRGRPVVAWGRALVLGAAVCAVVALPLLLTHDGAPLENLRSTSERFALKWAHFGSVYEPLLTVIEWLTPSWTNDPQEQLARAICLAALLLAGIGIWWRGRDAWRDLAHLFLAMTLLSPTAHPWYLLWALVLMPRARSAAVWILSLTLPLGYVALGDTIEWTVDWWVYVLAYGPVYAALGWTIARR